MLRLAYRPMDSNHRHPVYETGALTSELERCVEAASCGDGYPLECEPGPLMEDLNLYLPGWPSEVYSS